MTIVAKVLVSGLDLTRRNEETSSVGISFFLNTARTSLVILAVEVSTTIVLEDVALLTTSVSMDSLRCRKLGCGEGGQEECVLSVSLTGSSLTVTESADSLPQAVFMDTVGKHSSSISAKRKKC